MGAIDHLQLKVPEAKALVRRFAALECYDNVRADRLPVELRDRNPGAGLCRLVDGRWSGEDVS